jgi:hypothetical protein
MARHSTRPDLLQRRTHAGVHGFRGTEIMSTSWVFCCSHRRFALLGGLHDKR